MKNTKYHQSKSYIFSRQSYTGLEQQIPTPGLVYAVSRTTIVPPAARAYSLPLAAEESFGTSRESARQPAPPQSVWPNHSTHIRRVKRGSQQGTHTHIFSRTNISRPNTQAHTHASRYPYTRVAPQQSDNTQASERMRERPRRGVWQDKARFLSARTASRQPARMTEVTRAQYPNNAVVRSQTHNSARQKLVPVTMWVDQDLKAHLQGIAHQEDLSISAAGAAFLRKALQQHIDLNYSATLEPVFERLIGKFMRGISTRLAWLLVRVSIDCGQTRSLVTNILGRQPGMTTDLLRSLVKQSANTARGNITRRTPQLEDVIQSIEKWLLTDDKPDNKNRGEDK